MIEANEYSFDLFKILIGDFPIAIYLEIFIRVIIIMSFTLLIVRWIGKRAVGGLGSADVLLIIAMGSSVGDAMLYPTIPILIPLVVISLIAIFQQIYVYFGVKYESFRKMTHPTVVKLVENGKLMTENFTKDDIDRNEVYMLLRQSGIQYLSEVEHAYYEQSGKLSVYKFNNPDYENSILPEHIKNLSIKN